MMRSPDELMRSVIGYLSRRTAKPMHGVPLWSVVADMTGHGSTVGTEICERYGFDPHLLVREPVFVDDSCQVLRGWCSVCEEEYDLHEGGCPDGCEPEESADAAR